VSCGKKIAFLKIKKKKGGGKNKTHPPPPHPIVV